MKKLKKNFSSQKKTVEAMYDSCMNGCSCSVVSCPCGWDDSKNYSSWKTQQSNYTSAFKNGAW